jgi:hypothetical protein
MKKKFTTLSFVLCFVFMAGLCFSYAQQTTLMPRDNAIASAISQLEQKGTMGGELKVPFTPRENTIFTTLNQLGGREEAIEEALTGPGNIPGKELAGYGGTRSRRGSISYARDVASRVHYYLVTDAAYTDNVDSWPKKESDFTYGFTPGVRMSFPARNRSLNLDANLDNNFRNRHAENNTQALNVFAQNSFGLGRTTFSFSDAYFTNYIASSDFNIKKSCLTYYWKNAFSTKVGRDFNRIGFDVGYNRADYRYESEHQEDDRKVETYSIGQYLRIASKTRLSFDYSHSRTHYLRLDPRSLDANTDNFALELSGVLSPKITSSLGTSYQFADNKMEPGSRDRGFSADLAYKISRRSDLALALDYDIHREADASSRSDTYGLQLKLNHRLAFNPKLTLSFKNGFNYINYPKIIGTVTHERDYTYGLGLSYAFKRWLSCSLGWTHYRVESKLSPGYNRNTVLFKTQTKF